MRSPAHTHASWVRFRNSPANIVIDITLAAATKLFVWFSSQLTLYCIRSAGRKVIHILYRNKKITFLAYIHSSATCWTRAGYRSHQSRGKVLGWTTQLSFVWRYSHYITFKLSSADSMCAVWKGMIGWQLNCNKHMCLFARVWSNIIWCGSRTCCSVRSTLLYSDLMVCDWMKWN